MLLYIFLCWSLVGEPNGKYSVRGVCVDAGEKREWTRCLGLRAKSFFFFFFFFPQKSAGRGRGPSGRVRGRVGGQSLCTF